MRLLHPLSIAGEERVGKRSDAGVSPRCIKQFHKTTIFNAMNLIKERHAIDTALNRYRALLDTIPDELFTQTPPGSGWCYAEAYSHILKATLGSTIALERCAHHTCEPTSKGLTAEGRFMMVFGTFPFFRTKVPESVAARIPAEKISKEEAKNLIAKCRRRVNETTPLLKHAAEGARYKHTRLGYLNAGQWFKFIRIHLQHHLKQLKRIENKFYKV